LVDKLSIRCLSDMLMVDGESTCVDCPPFEFPRTNLSVTGSVSVVALQHVFPDFPLSTSIASMVRHGDEHVEPSYSDVSKNLHGHDGGAPKTGARTAMVATTNINSFIMKFRRTAGRETVFAYSS